MKSKNRNTARKDILLRQFATGGYKPMLLEEIRWKTFLEEKEQKGLVGESMSRSYMNSFSRTIRESCLGFRIIPLGRPHYIPSGIVAKSVIYRSHSFDKINDFLQINGSCVALNIDTIGDVESEKRRLCLFYRLFLEQPHGLVRQIETLDKGQIPINNYIYAISDKNIEGSDMIELVFRQA